MNLYEDTQPERTMSLMIDHPVPIVNTEYAYYLGELLPFNVSLYIWMYVNERYLTSSANMRTIFNALGIRRKMTKIIQNRDNLGFAKKQKTNDELKLDLINILEH